MIRAAHSLAVMQWETVLCFSSAVNTDSWMLPDALASRRPSCENGRSAATMTEVSTSDLVIGELLLLPYTFAVYYRSSTSM